MEMQHTVQQFLELLSAMTGIILGLLITFTLTLVLILLKDIENGKRLRQTDSRLAKLEEFVIDGMIKRE